MAVQSSGRKTVLQRIWGFLTSRKVAVVLLLAILALLLLSLWLPQVPTDLEPAGQEAWRTAAQERYGPRLDFYERLGLLEINRTPLFTALLAALLLNTLACTVERLGRLWRELTRRPALRLPDTAYEAGDWQAQGLSREQARHILHRWASRLFEQAGSSHYLYRETWRLAPLGTVLTHLGLFLFVLTALLYAQLSWRERLLVEPGHPDGPIFARMEHRSCSVWNVGNEIRTDVGAGPSIRGLLQVVDGPSIVQGWIAPAAPLSACGANFYLKSYSLELLVQAFDKENHWLQIATPEDSSAPSCGTSGPDCLTFPEGVSEGSFDVPELAWHVTVMPSIAALGGSTEATFTLRVAQASGNSLRIEDTLSSHGWLDLEVLGARLSLYPDIILVVEAVHDPSWPCFLAGGVALVLGGTLSLLFRQRRLWARLSEDGTLWVRLGSREETDIDAEVAALAQALRRTQGGAP